MFFLYKHIFAKTNSNLDNTKPHCLIIYVSCWKIISIITMRIILSTFNEASTERSFSPFHVLLSFYWDIIHIPYHKIHLFFFFLLWPWHTEIPRLGIEPVSQRQPKPQQWQCEVINPLHHQGFPKSTLLKCIIP